MVSLSGEWRVYLNDNADDGGKEPAVITLPGTINGSGLGKQPGPDTEWNSGLFNPFWYEREEYKGYCEEWKDPRGTRKDTEETAPVKEKSAYKVPFLSQPRTVYAGTAVYEREFETDSAGEWFLLVELSKWRVSVSIDGICIGVDESLCTPFLFGPVSLRAGKHTVRVAVDNSMLHFYRPDSHSISDCLNACWNGMAGRICLMNPDEKTELDNSRLRYAKEHPVSVGVEGRNIVVNGKAEYMRGTHFGGGFYDTLYPATDRAYWDRLMKTVKEWGFNFIRFHSFCPPEACFAAADEAGVYLQAECGMWNDFDPEDTEMYGLLIRETRKILEWFGHHPSFIMLSPTNEPGGKWYDALRRWVKDAKEINTSLGYEGRRLFTAQSGWYYDVPPAEITGTDYIYFHRSAYGPIHGGMIRNRWGWRGKDYSPSVEGCRLPVIAHEMGQWCSYPDFDVIDKFTGAVRGGNYEIFRSCAARNGVLGFNKDFVYASGRAQVRLLKEDFEANFRTKEITGFEYLDLHDYTGQGTALVGVLDPFWDSKGFVTPEEFRTFNSEIVILARCRGYVFKSSDTADVDFEICNFSGKIITGGKLFWAIHAYTDEEEKSRFLSNDFRRFASFGSICGTLTSDSIAAGGNTPIGHIEPPLDAWNRSTKAVLMAVLTDQIGQIISRNYWDITVFVQNDSEQAAGGSVKDVDEGCEGQSESGSKVCDEAVRSKVCDVRTAKEAAEDKVSYVRTAEEAEILLKAGKTVVFCPYMSDMDFECPPLSIRNVFWNAQMGPNWGRSLGIVADTGNALFGDFPTERAGGWEWEDIFERARGFNIDPKYDAIVRGIDDWNRNFPLSLIFEGRVLNGKMLFCSADLSGSFEERPAAYTLKQAIMKYAKSDIFDPKQEIAWEDITRHLKPLYKGMDIIDRITVKYIEGKAVNSLQADDAGGSAKDRIPILAEGEPETEAFNNLTGINPNHAYRARPLSFPVSFTITLKYPVKLERLYVLPIQNDRDFPGVIKEYGIRVNGKDIKGGWKDSFETQYSDIIGEVTDSIELTVYSTYSMGEAVRWYEEKDGFHKRTAAEPLCITMAALGVEYSAGDGMENGNGEPYAAIDEYSLAKCTFRRNDELFWKGEVSRLGQTIEQ